MRRVSLISSRTSAGTFPLSSPHANRVSLMPSVMRNGHARSQTAWPYTNRIQMDATLRLLPSVRLQHVSSLAHPACCAQHYGINAHVPCSLTHQPQPSGGGATPSRHLPINLACAYSGLNPLDGAPRVRNGMPAFTHTRRPRQRNRLARLQRDTYGGRSFWALSRRRLSPARQEHDQSASAGPCTRRTK